MLITPATVHLDKYHIQYRIFSHPGEVHSLEQAAFERGQRPEQIIRSILFRYNQKNYLLALIHGNFQISWRSLRHWLGVQRLSLATKEELFEITGYLPGSVTPFGIYSDIRIVSDPRIFLEDEISIGSGETGTTIIMKSKDIKQALPQIELIGLV